MRLRSEVTLVETPLSMAMRTSAEDQGSGCVPNGSPALPQPGRYSSCYNLAPPHGLMGVLPSWPSSTSAAAGSSRERSVAPSATTAASTAADPRVSVVEQLGGERDLCCPNERDDCGDEANPTGPAAAAVLSFSGERDLCCPNERDDCGDEANPTGPAAAAVLSFSVAGLQLRSEWSHGTSSNRLLRSGQRGHTHINH
eukprot:Skav225541  [mRNA]  locus=scaffold339:84499:89271:- [translate_table: standard]